MFLIYRVIHDLLTLLQEMISWVLIIKTLIPKCILFSIVTEVRVLLNSNRPPVNRASPHYATLKQLEQEVNGSCNSQIALFTTERRDELWPAVAFSENYLQHRSI